MHLLHPLGFLRPLLLSTTACLAIALTPVAMPSAHALVITDLGIDPTSASGAFSNSVGGAAFDDQYTFQLIGGPQFLTIASVTNVFPKSTDFITGFTGSVFLQVGAIGGGDDIIVIGPVAASANCGPLCQGFAGSAVVAAGNYYLDISGQGGGTSGYGGNLATAQIGGVPEPATWAMMLLGFLGVGLFGMSRRSRTAKTQLRIV